MGTHFVMLSRKGFDIGPFSVAGITQTYASDGDAQLQVEMLRDKVGGLECSVRLIKDLESFLMENI